jgi:signal transduction histidine kinase
MSAKTETIRVRISPGVRVWQAVLVAAALVASLLLGLVIGRANGNRATPDQVLSEFAERMAGTYGIDDVLERMSLILAQGTGATRVDVWLRVGRELRPVAAWPADAGSHAAIPLLADDALPAFDGVTRAVAVRHGDELLGALALEKPRNESLSPTEDKLLQDLASQAGLVLRNVRLTAELQANIDELRASRRRLVGAQDEERRKIERNLHDGAQQQLVALTVQLGLLERLAEDPERVRQMASQLQGGLRDALDDLRDLAPSARHLPTAAGGQGSGRGARGAGPQGCGDHHERPGRGRPVSPRGREARHRERARTGNAGAR